MTYAAPERLAESASPLIRWNIWFAFSVPGVQPSLALSASRSGKEAMDRISGSGVFGRDPDTILTLTRHEDDDTFVVETALRNCPPLPPFCIHWDFPLMSPAEGADPQALRTKQAANKPRVTVDEIIAILPQKPTARSEWVKLGDDELGVKKTVMYKLINQAHKAKKVDFRDGFFHRNAA